MVDSPIVRRVRVSNAKEELTPTPLTNGTGGHVARHERDIFSPTLVDKAAWKNVAQSLGVSEFNAVK
jgi:hypothetical protein